MTDLGDEASELRRRLQELRAAVRRIPCSKQAPTGDCLDDKLDPCPRCAALALAEGGDRAKR